MTGYSESMTGARGMSIAAIEGRLLWLEVRRSLGGGATAGGGRTSC